MQQFAMTGLPKVELKPINGKKQNMVILIIIIAGLQLTSASDIFEDCPIDNDALVGVLDTFYKDLSFAKVVTESRQRRDYKDLLEEIRNVVRPGPVRDRIVRGVMELSNDYWLQFTRTLYGHRNMINADDQAQSYSNFLFAEFTRLRGSTDSFYIKGVIKARQKHTGVSVNQLERLDGMVVLQILCKFNHDVDRSYGLWGSPDYQLLSLLHPLLGHETQPLCDLRSAVLDRLFNTDPRFGYTPMNTSDTVPEALHRDECHLNDLSGQSVSKASIKAILCEFAHKLSILEVDPVDDGTVSDYSSFIDEVREFDADFADKLLEDVVKFIDVDVAKGLDNVNAIRRSLDESDHSKSKGIFLTYIEVELKLKLRERCNLDLLSWVGDELHVIRYLRQTRVGVSLGNIMKLTARFACLQLRCFHKRVKWAYRLDGTENEQQLEEKRAEFGTSQRILPPFDSVHLTD